MVYQATIIPKCSIYSDSTMVYVYYGETKSEYHQIHSINKYVVLEERRKLNSIYSLGRILDDIPRQTENEIWNFHSWLYY